MAKLEPVRCPQCGAQVKIDAKSDFVTCAYCHVSSFIKRSPAAVAPPNVPVVVVQGRSALAGILLLLVGALLVAGGGVVALLVLSVPSVAPAPHSAQAPPLVLPRLPTATPSTATTASPAPAIQYRVEHRPLLADVNADGKLDIVTMVSELPANERRYVVFDGNGFKRLAATPALDSGYAMSGALAPGRLILETKQGQLGGYDLKSGDLQWTTALGDRVARFCAGGNNETIQVESADGRRIDLDTKTGRQTTLTTKAPCGPVPNDQERHYSDPRDRRDARAPAGVESIHCGSVRVMGSENYFVPDQCQVRAHIDSDALDGVSTSSLWKHGAGYVVIGSRTPGTRIATVGLLARGKFVWKSDVPETNPLEAREGAPEHVALLGGRLLANYTFSAGNKAFLTAFDVENGKRTWTVPLASSASIQELSGAGDRVLVRSDYCLFAYALADGALLATLGTPR